MREHITFTGSQTLVGSSPGDSFDDLLRTGTSALRRPAQTSIHLLHALELGVGGIKRCYETRPLDAYPFPKHGLFENQAEKSRKRVKPVPIVRLESPVATVTIGVLAGIAPALRARAVRVIAALRATT